MTVIGEELHARGLACEKAGDAPSAFEAYRLSAKADPRVAAPFVGLARILARNHQRAEAVACLERAAACEPKNAAIRTLLGRTLSQDGKLEEARRQFEIALTLDPHADGAAIGLGAVHEDSGDRMAAAEVYRRLLHDRPFHGEGLAGLLGVVEGDALDAALAVARDGVQVAPDPDAATIGVTTGLLIATLAFLIGNRLLPLGMADRAVMEVRAFHIVWVIAALHAVIRGRAAWAEQAWLIAVACGLAVLLNAATTAQPLPIAIASGLWHVAGVDLMLLTGAAIAIASAIGLGRSADRRQPAPQRADARP